MITTPSTGDDGGEEAVRGVFAPRGRRLAQPTAWSQRCSTASRTRVGAIDDGEKTPCPSARVQCRFQGALTHVMHLPRRLGGAVFDVFSNARPVPI